MKCPNCGAEVIPNTKCEYCGSFVEKEQTHRETYREMHRKTYQETHQETYQERNRETYQERKQENNQENIEQAAHALGGFLIANLARITTRAKRRAKKFVLGVILAIVLVIIICLLCFFIIAHWPVI